MSVPFREVAGGLILFLFAVEMVIGEHKKQQVEATRDTPMQLAVYPLAIPNLAGPGAMLTVILRTDNSRVSPGRQSLSARACARERDPVGDWKALRRLVKYSALSSAGRWLVPPDSRSNRH